MGPGELGRGGARGWAGPTVGAMVGTESVPFDAWGIGDGHADVPPPPVSTPPTNRLTPLVLRPSHPQVKLWAKQHDINNAHCGTLNSWSLALMALFSLQTYPQPPGALLPPLWRLFWDEEPSGAGGKGRPLQVGRLRGAEGAERGARGPTNGSEGSGRLLAGHSLLTAWRTSSSHAWDSRRCVLSGLLTFSLLGRPFAPLLVNPFLSPIRHSQDKSTSLDVLSSHFLSHYTPIVSLPLGYPSRPLSCALPHPPPRTSPPL